MKEVETSRKQIIKKVAGIFLVGLLVLTFFSNTIMNYSLPEVATEPVTSGTVSNKVRGQGTVETNSDYEVTVSGNRKVKEVKFEAGDTVKKGDVLFTFEEGENTELDEAEDMLDQMELDYAKSLLKVLPDYESDAEGIKEAKENLAKAVKDKEKADKNAKKLKTATKEAETAKKNVEEQQKKVNGLQEKIEAYGEVGDYNTAKELVEALTKELEGMRVQLADLKEDLADAKEMGEDTKSYDRSIRDLEKNIKDKEAELENQKKVAEALKSTSSTYTQLQADLKAANKTLATYQETLEKKNAAVEELKALPTVEEAKNAVKEMKKTVNQLVKALADRKEQDGISQQIEDMDMQVAREKIEEQKELVNKLKNSSDLKEIKSEEDGVIAQIDCKEGDAITADVPIARIQLVDSGYLVKINISKMQSKLVRVGDEATIENIWGEDVSATVKSLKADPENPNQNMILAFEVKGEVNPGETLVLSVGEKSNRYDAVVPNSAIKEDAKGKFVLIVTVKGTPLGNRYKVKRADVDVLASDDNNSGVTGAVYEYDNVVTNSSKPLESGMQVRLVE